MIVATERIILEVENDTAKKWKYTDIKVKQRIYKEMDQLLKVILNKQEDDLWPFLEKLRKDAEQKGFNDKILKDILDER